MGITNKTDGKSSSAGGNASDKTQRSKDSDSYSADDPTDTHEYRKEQVAGPRLYFFIGVVLISLAIFLALQRRPMDLDYERELVYQRRAQREEEERIAREDQLRSRQFRDA